jgi:two-component system response regulator YesN
MTGYSKSYVSQVFRQTTGESVISYFNRLKIKEAKRLIRENRLTMSEISDALSYNDPRYFSLMFKRITGKTPTEYKNSINKT